MNAMFARIAGVLIVAALTAAPAIARELAPRLRALLEHFEESRRVASAYLRTRNIDLGAIEIEKLRDRWLADRSLVQSPGAADERLVTALAETESLIAESLQSVDASDVERALAQLDAAGVPLRTWRAANGIRFFSDCIAQVTASYEALDRYRTSPPDLVDVAVREAIVTGSARVAEALVQCDREAPAKRAERPRIPKIGRRHDGKLAANPASARARRRLISPSSVDRAALLRTTARLSLWLGSIIRCVPGSARIRAASPRSPAWRPRGREVPYRPTPCPSPSRRSADEHESARPPSGTVP